MKTLHNKIMRRVYYAFAMRLATHQITIQAALFVLALFVFARMVHVASVIDNMLATELGSLPLFVLNAFLSGEMLTLIAVGVMTFTVLSIPLRLRSELMPRVQVV